MKGTHVLVIGGTSGIGYAVAQGAAESGAQVTVASRHADHVAAAVRRSGGRVAGAVLDVTRPAEVEGFFSDSGFDHIAFTAGDWGGPRRASLSDLDLARAGSLFEVRFWGALTVAKYGAPRIRESGSLTLTNGMIAHRPQKGSTVATAMAGAIEHLVTALAVELSPVRVNAVCPGLIQTEWRDRLGEESARVSAHQLTSDQPIPRPGEPAEVAHAYLYLMAATYTTGQVLQVEGGRALV